MTRKKLKTKTKTKTKIRKRKNKNKNRHTKKIGGMAMMKGLAGKVPGVKGLADKVPGMKGLADNRPPFPGTINPLVNGNTTAVNRPPFHGTINPLVNGNTTAVNRPQIPVVTGLTPLSGKSNIQGMKSADMKLAGMNLSGNMNLAVNNLASNNSLKGVGGKSRFSTQLKNKERTELNNQMNQANETVKENGNAYGAELKEAVAPLKKLPLFNFVSSSIAKILENGSLFDKIRQTATREYGTYKSDVSKLKKPGLQNYNDACALIYRYYHKNISINYPFLREAEDIEQIGKDKSYMSAQIKLLNSCSEREDSHFMDVFNNRTQFTELILADSGNMDEMQRLIEEKFNISTGDDKIPINCSYLILDILYDIHSEIDEATEILSNNPTVITEPSKAKIEFMKDITRNIQQHINIDIGNEPRVLEAAIAIALTPEE